MITNLDQFRRRLRRRVRAARPKRTGGSRRSTIVEGTFFVHVVWGLALIAIIGSVNRTPRPETLWRLSAWLATGYIYWRWLMYTEELYAGPRLRFFASVPIEDAAIVRWFWRLQRIHSAPLLFVFLGAYVSYAYVTGAGPVGMAMGGVAAVIQWMFIVATLAELMAFPPAPAFVVTGPAFYLMFIVQVVALNRLFNPAVAALKPLNALADYLPTSWVSMAFLGALPGGNRSHIGHLIPVAIMIALMYRHLKRFESTYRMPADVLNGVNPLFASPPAEPETFDDFRRLPGTTDSLFDSAEIEWQNVPDDWNGHREAAAKYTGSEVAAVARIRWRFEERRSERAEARRDVLTRLAARLLSNEECRILDFLHGDSFRLLPSWLMLMSMASASIMFVVMCGSRQADPAIYVIGILVGVAWMALHGARGFEYVVTGGQGAPLHGYFPLISYRRGTIALLKFYWVATIARLLLWSIWFLFLLWVFGEWERSLKPVGGVAGALAAVGELNYFACAMLPLYVGMMCCRTTKSDAGALFSTIVCLLLILPTLMMPKETTLVLSAAILVPLLSWLNWWWYGRTFLSASCDFIIVDPERLRNARSL